MAHMNPSPEHEPEPEYEAEKEPWWNDGDKMGGLIATTLCIVVLAIMIAFVIKFLFWLF